MNEPLEFAKLVETLHGGTGARYIAARAALADAWRVKQAALLREAELCIEEQAQRDAHDYTSVRSIEVASELVALDAILHPEEGAR